MQHSLNNCNERLVKTETFWRRVNQLWKELNHNELLTNCPANSGIYSIIANRTLHLLSSANSTIAGRRLWESCVMPITSLTQSRLEMIFSLTSGHSSFNCDKNSGSKCSTVLQGHWREIFENQNESLIISYIWILHLEPGNILTFVSQV